MKIILTFLIVIFFYNATFSQHTKTEKDAIKKTKVKSITITELDYWQGKYEGEGSSKYYFEFNKEGNIIMQLRWTPTKHNGGSKDSIWTKTIFSFDKKTMTNYGDSIIYTSKSYIKNGKTIRDSLVGKLEYHYDKKGNLIGIKRYKNYPSGGAPTCIKTVLACNDKGQIIKYVLYPYWTFFQRQDSLNWTYLYGKKDKIIKTSCFRSYADTIMTEKYLDNNKSLKILNQEDTVFCIYNSDNKVIEESPYYGNDKFPKATFEYDSKVNLTMLTVYYDHTPDNIGVGIVPYRETKYDYQYYK